jgi:CHAT domain-containing protein
VAFLLSTPLLMKHLLIAFFIICSGVCRSQACCTFDLPALPVMHFIPSNEALEACLGVGNNCDARLYHAGKMINSFRANDFDGFHESFQTLSPLIDAFPKDDEVSIKIIFAYTFYIEHLGESAKAISLYKYILNNTKKGTLFYSLSAISISGINSNSEDVLSITDSLLIEWMDSSNEKRDQVAQLIIKFSAYIPDQYIYAFYTKISKSELEPVGAHVRFSFFTQIINSKFELNITVSDSEWEEAQALFDELPKENTIIDWTALLSNRALINQEYLEVTRLAKNNLERIVGKFDSPQELIDKIKLDSKKSTSHIFRYATSLLFQTRLGKGISVVDDAFDIYEAVYNLQLSRTIDLPNLLVAQKQDIAGANPLNALIIATYLFQKTNKVDYLNRSLSIIEGYSAMGINYWTTARRMMREDAVFAKQIIRERAALTAMMQPDKDASLPEVVASINLVDSLRTILLENYPALSEEVATTNKIDLNELRVKLRQDTSAFLGFYANDQVLYRVYVDRDSIAVVLLNDVRVEINKLAKQLHQQSSINKDAAHSEVTARRLYQLLFRGLDERLPTRLRIVAEGPLASIPFAALRRESSGAARFLGVECAISRQFSIGGMLQLESLATASAFPYPLALAPAFKSNFLQAAELRQAGFYLSPLFYNTNEVEKLEARGPGSYYYDKRATLAEYQARAEDHSIIHLATHAISSQTDGLRSRIYLLDENEEPTSLYAADIGEQTLSADLVVLSACETGTGGQHALEGTIGLHRAYLAAGARSVVASLWAIDDYATAELMDGFYDNLAKDMAPDRALQAARKAYLDRFPDASPYKWAAFSAYGGMKPVNWDREPSPLPYFLYGGLGLMALAGLGFSLKKMRHAA